ncbi:MAG: TetR/AcrR family transcriptional regulator [Proteobacteria bacterium]|nr:TetR/AcrR family transcriptional regulator [Pseudomonadota bacterium]
MVDVASSRNRLQVDERRAQLLQLGLELFAERTYDDISIDEIARAAGISKGLLYHYFPGKRAFYLAALREAARQLLGEAVVDHEPGRASIEQMRQGMDAYLAFVEKRSVPYAFLLRGDVGGDSEVRAVVEETRRAFFERILEGVGEPDNQRLRIAVRGFVGFVEAASLEWIERKHMTRQELSAMLVEICVSTIAIALGRPRE